MLIVEGASAAPQSFDLLSLSALPEQVADISAFFPKRAGGAVWLRALLDRAGRSESARYVTLSSADGAFAISVPLKPLLERALLVYRLGAGELPASQGGPVRLLLTGAVECQAEELDACAQVKHLAKIRLTAEREPDIGHSH